MRLKYAWSGVAMLSFLAIVASLYVEYVKELHPCPLCFMQRVCVFLSFLIALLGMLSSRISRSRVSTYVLIVLSCFGLYFSGRQLWLQSLPPEHLPACLPGLDVLVRYFPWQDTLHALFWGSSSCGEVEPAFLGFTMPIWSVIYFLLQLIVAIKILNNQRPHHRKHLFLD